MKILTGSAFAAIGQLEDSDDEEDDDDPNGDDEEEEEATNDNPDSDDDGLGDGFEAKIEALMDKPDPVNARKRPLR